MTQPAAAPFIDGRIAANALELMDVSGLGMRLRPLENAIGRRHRREDVDGENQRCDHRRPALGDIIARAETDAGSNEAYFLAQLRAVVAAFETPADQLLAKYRGRPGRSGPVRLRASWLGRPVRPNDRDQWPSAVQETVRQRRDRVCGH